MMGVSESGIIKDAEGMFEEELERDVEGSDVARREALSPEIFTKPLA